MGLQRNDLNYVPVQPAVAFDGADQDTWTLRPSALLLPGDDDTTFVVSLVLPSGNEVLLTPPNEIITYGTLRSGKVAAADNPRFDDSDVWIFPSPREGSLEYAGAMAIDDANSFRAIVVQRAIGATTPGTDYTANLKVYEYISTGQTAITPSANSIDSVKAFFRNPGVSDSAVASAMAMASAMSAEIGELPSATMDAIELNLACYFLSANTPIESQDKLGDSQASFVVENSENPYWRNAVALDTTGKLARSFGKSFTVHFASTPESSNYYDYGSWQ